MAGIRWIPEAEQIGRVTGGAMDTPNLPPRVVWHTVEFPTGATYFRSMADYLLGAGVWPQVLYDPETDRLGQFCALDQSGRALRNSGSTRTNRTGRVCIQIEVLGRAAKPFTEQPTWRPGPNFRALMAAIRSWGVPDVFPAGRPQAYPGDHDDRDLATWLNRGGHYGHSQIPGNDHGDPGAINPARLWAAAGITQNLTEDDMPAPIDLWNYRNPALESRDAYQILRDAAADARKAAAGPGVQVDASAVAAALAADEAFVAKLAAGIVDETHRRLEA